MRSSLIVIAVVIVVVLWEHRTAVAYVAFRDVAMRCDALGLRRRLRFVCVLCRFVKLLHLLSLDCNARQRFYDRLRAFSCICEYVFTSRRNIIYAYAINAHGGGNNASPSSDTDVRAQYCVAHTFMLMREMDDVLMMRHATCLVRCTNTM